MCTMKILKTFTLFILALFFAGCVSRTAKGTSDNKKIIVAYVTSWTSVVPDPVSMTHINYAFGHVTDSFDAVRIDNEERLRQIVALKKQKPELKILLSIGGWGSGGFSEMVTDSILRKSFAMDCKRVVDEFDIDGIDIDWEYPTSSVGKISSAPTDTENYTLMMRDIREAIGEGKLLTLASDASAKFINFRDIDPYIDFVNIMSYDIDEYLHHHAGLYRSGLTGHASVEESVAKHVAAGVPIEKLVMGIPFYARGSKVINTTTKYKDLANFSDLKEAWDDKAKASYLVDVKGEFVGGYDSPKSIAEKCQFVKDRGMLGMMYWEYDGDDAEGTLRKAVYDNLMK